MGKPMSAQDRGETDAVKLVFIEKRAWRGMTWGEIERAGRKAFKDFPTRNTWKSWKKKTEGVDPANWAPALAPDWKGGGEGQPVSTEAFEMLVRLMFQGGKNGTGYPLKHAYEKVRTLADAKGWHWPSIRVIRYRWVRMRARVNAGFGLWQMDFASRQALTADNCAAARAAMQMYRGDTGRILGVKPTIMVVSPALEAAALDILNPALTETGGTNKWAGTTELIVTPYIAE